MKKLLILLQFISLVVFGQQENHFIIENNQLEWQKVFESKLKLSNIENIIKGKGIFKNIVFEKNLITGEIENIPADYKGAGKSSWNTSFYVQNTNISASFFIEFKEGRFRVTLNGINLKTINELSGNGISVMSANSIQPLSDFAIKKTKFRKGFLKSDAKIYEHTFSNLFNFNNYKTKSNDW